MNQILYNTNKSMNNTVIKIIILIIIICAILLFSTIFALINKDSEKILKNVFISGKAVGDMTKFEAEELLSENIQEYTDRDVALVVDDEKFVISAEEIGFECSNLDDVLESAYSYGRSGNLFQNNFAIFFSNFKNKEFELEYSLDENVFNDWIKEITEENDTISADDTYVVSGDKIYIEKGQDGVKVDVETLKEYIYMAIVNDVEEVKIPINDSLAAPIDFEKLYSEVSVPVQNASFTTDGGFNLVVDKAGVDFDVQDAKAKYNELKPNETMIIELRVVEPTIRIADLDDKIFKDVLATYSNTYDQTDKNRVKNLQVASERCNNTILYPGEEFSFHNTIGTRTIANGYASAHSFAGGRVVNSVGGGICQISSTLYNIVLMSDLEVTERTAHGMYVTYVKPSLDATISEGVFDFKFKNNRTYPIKIASEVKNGTVTMSILGIKEADDPIIEIESVVLETLKWTTVNQYDSTMLSGTSKVVQEPVNGYRSESYRVEKDADGNIISRTLISKDKYIPTDKIVKVGTKVVAPPPQVEPEEPVIPVVPEEPDRELPPGWGSPESPYN